MHSYTNQLINETSPYLLQHAHNPVNWYPWSGEAFAKARQEDKPVLVSIGYAACHWCHVMERESFEDPATADIMNRHFINIKVDREERPDVDHIYMDAVQAMTGSGGWPLNVFLTPDGKPFYGGTYFPPRRAFNRASWTETLQAVAVAYQQKKEDIYQQAENLTGHLKASNAFGINTHTAADTLFQRGKMKEAFENIMKIADKEWGGFGPAPKFPQTFTITFLLRYYHMTGNQPALEQAVLSLDKMIQGGIYDHIGGGFARYSTDAEWLVPHFEKMLYDNALLVSTLAEACQLTKKDIYRQVIAETLQFAERELLHPGGGFYSALDADSEGVEGKYYVWSYEEVTELLGKEADIFCRYFNITPAGNWEHTNILWVKKPMPQFAEANNIPLETLQAIIITGKEKLLQKRSERVRPALDDKVLLSWNALMNIAYSKAYMATGNGHYKDIAVRNMQFLLQAFHQKDNIYFHTWKNDQARHPAFLDDYSNLIYALVYVAQITGDYTYLQKANAITWHVLQSFKDNESPLFFYTYAGQKDILLRKKEVYDGATPSGNAMMAANLYMLSILLDEKKYQQQAEEMLISLGDISVKYPTSFGVWLSLLQQVIHGTAEIAIVGADCQNKLNELLKIYIPYALIMAAPAAFDEYPLLKDKVVPEGQTKLFLCQSYSCRQPVSTVQELAQLLNANNL